MYRRRFADRLGLWPRALGLDMTKFSGAQLRRRREAHALTTTEFAVLLGTSHSHVSRLESGQTPATPLDVLVAAALFRCSPGAFFTDPLTPPALRDVVGVDVGAREFAVAGAES